jgi:hypothetical protein
MYEDYSRQVLPSKKYRELLGSAICVFNSNNQFVIENILHVDSSKFNWYELTDMTSGELSVPIKKTITKNSDTKITTLFQDLVSKRNRILHSFLIPKDEEHLLRTKNRKHEQFNITEEYLLEFIRDNGRLSMMLYRFRGE